MNLAGMPLATASTEVITNNRFYPDLSVGEFIENYAIATAYGDNTNMVEQKLSLAIAMVNKDLSVFRALKWAERSTLADVPSDQVNGESVLESLYKHAVFSLAKSTLLVSSLGESHRDKGAVQAQVNIDSERHWLMQSNQAVNQLMNSSKNLSVELI